MIAPHELKNKTFARVVRGYNPVEVDEYFDFLIEKYTEAYKAAADFEQKLSKIEAKYAELANDEESIRSAILKAQKLGEAIVNNAKKEASEKTAALEAKCDQIVANAKAKVELEKENIATLRKSAIDFQHKLYSEYIKHVEMIKDMKIDEMTGEDDFKAENEAFVTAKDEILNPTELSIITGQDQNASSESNN